MLKLLEENTGSILQDIGVGQEFKNSIPFAQELRPTTEKWHLRKLESFCTAKEIIKQRNPEWERIFASKTSD